MKKYDIDLENSSTLNFEELYTAIMKKTRHIEFKCSLMKTMREDAFRKLNHQKESLMRSDAVIVCVNNMFLFLSAVELVKKLKSKIISNAVIQSQLDDLSSKAEIL